MVRHGTLKKRRSGRKVSRFGKSGRGKNIRKQIKNLEIRKNWDTNKSPAANLLAMGIDPYPNRFKRQMISITSKTSNPSDNSSETNNNTTTR